MTTDAGFLNDLGLDNVEADPNYIADGQYPGFVFADKLLTKKDGSTSWVITYKVAPDVPRFGGKTQDEFYNVAGAPDKPETNPTEQNKSWLKKRVLSLGVSEDRVGKIKPGEVTGTAVFFSIVHKKGYQNIGVEVLLRDEKTNQVIGQDAPVGTVDPVAAMGGAPIAVNTPAPQQSDVSALM